MSSTFGNITIPPQQDIPPAGFDHIAFRPACEQLVPVLQANGLTAWTLALPDGRVETLAQYEPMDPVAAYGWMDGAGLCKIGGENVPIVYSKQVPQRSMPQMVEQPTGQSTPEVLAPVTEDTAGGGLMPILVGSVVLALVGAGFYAFTQRKGTPKAIQKEPQSSTQPKGKGKASDTAKAKQARLDDILGGK